MNVSDPAAVDVEETTLTFTFDVTVKLKRPLKL